MIKFVHFFMILTGFLYRDLQDFIRIFETRKNVYFTLNQSCMIKHAMQSSFIKLALVKG